MGGTELADDAGAADGTGLAADERQASDCSAGPDELSLRLRPLPPGHPSSPYAADGSRRPPVPRLRDLEPPEFEADSADEIRPLTDEEHDEHAADVRACLEKAHADGLATDEQYTIDPAREIWSDDRDDPDDVKEEMDR